MSVIAEVCARIQAPHLSSETPMLMIYITAFGGRSLRWMMVEVKITELSCCTLTSSLGPGVRRIPAESVGVGGDLLAPPVAA